MSGTCLYWRCGDLGWGIGEQRQRDGLRKSNLGKGASLWGRGGEGGVRMVCGLPFGTITRLRGVFLDFKHEETMHVEACDVISVAEDFSGLSTLSILLPPFFAFFH